MTDKLKKLVQRFGAEEARLCKASGKYSEAEARIEFIDPLFSLLGWDMNNSAGMANSLKDVVREESQPTETSSKRPDYTFRITAKRQFFVEAKKPSVDILSSKESAFQVRSYGWTAGLPISILTNFRTFRVYDTTAVPDPREDANVGLLLEIHYTELEKRLDELLGLFGREAVAKGSIGRHFDAGGSGGSLPINVVFLERFNDWRLRIASDLHGRYPKLNTTDLNDIAQKVINRFIFIRMCEDRGIEGGERLKKVIEKKDLVELRQLISDLDRRYNTGLFDTTTDPLHKDSHIDADLLGDLVDELYFPKAPYSFGVLDADFLGQVYEVFLTKRMALDVTGKVVLEDKPAYEGREVVTTPQPLVDEIVRRTIHGRLAVSCPESRYDLATVLEKKVLDVAVGSGRFLLRCLDELIDAAIKACLESGDHHVVYKKSENDYRLNFDTKKSLLQSCLYGIDIDYNAVEVARFSLIIKLLEDESHETLPAGQKILPNLDANIIWGNSIVDENFDNASQEVIEATLPMNWTSRGLGNEFDAVVGNPPYVKTEDMKLATPHELAYYKREYETAYKQFDKYFLFIEKALKRLAEGAWLGMVIPNKWMTIESGKRLRALLSRGKFIVELVDFGNELLFEGKSTYVCLLVLSREEKSSFFYRRVDDYSEWSTTPSEKGSLLPYSLIDQNPESSWVLPANDDEASVLSILKTNSCRMADVADVLNGIQTSADAVYAIKEWTESGDEIHFVKDGLDWRIEKSITKPYLMDSTSRVKSYSTIEADALVIFPYLYGENGNAILIASNRIQSDYPLAHAYFKHYRERLEKRNISPSPGPDEYYQYGRHQALSSAFLGPKIIYSVNQVGDKYAYDSSGIGFASGGTAGEVSITNVRNGYTIEFLLALLHQRSIEYFLRKRGSAFRGGYYSRGSAVVSDCPVPILDLTDPSQSKIMASITEATREILAAHRELSSKSGRGRVRLERQIQSLSERLDGLFNDIWGFDGLDKKIFLPGEPR